jgi:hypothetical protein
MITFTCPSCQGKCQVADAMSGRKMKCPKCGTRIRHHADGTIELLSLKEPPPPAPAAAGVPPAPPAKDSTAALAHVAGKLLSQEEGRQNAAVLWGVAAFLALAFSGTGLALGLPVLAVGPVAALLVALLAWLLLRARRRPPPPAGRNIDGDKTEPLGKA